MPDLKQYREIKRRYPDTVILWRVDKFFLAYEEDALTTSGLVDLLPNADDPTGLQLEQSNYFGTGRIAVAKFHHFRLDDVIPKIIRSGVKVAVCEQMTPEERAKYDKKPASETPKAEVQINEQFSLF
jgi:DNA mismatch repair protein MutS